MLVLVLVLASRCFVAGHPAVFQAGQPRLKSIEFLYSMLDVGRSMFDVHSYIRSVWLVLVIGYCDLEFVCNLVLVIWIFTIAQFEPDQSFFYRSDWTLAASGWAET